jgi:hypothetical protein
MSRVLSAAAVVHDMDSPSTSYDRPEANLVAAPEVAIVHQRFLVNFIKNGDPNVGVEALEFDGYDARC